MAHLEPDSTRTSPLDRFLMWFKRPYLLLERLDVPNSAASIVSSTGTALSGYSVPQSVIDYHGTRVYERVKGSLATTARLARGVSDQVTWYNNLLYYKTMAALDWLAPPRELRYSEILANLDEYLRCHHPKKYLVTNTALFFAGNAVWKLNSGDRSANVIDNKHAHLTDFFKKSGFAVSNSGIE